jgi:hypothetical protein
VTSTSAADSRQTIIAMIHRYCELFDTGDFDGFAAQFAHGQWHRAEPGAAATRQWIADHVLTYDGRPGTQHLTTNVIVDVDEDAGTATASSYITVMQGLPDFPMQPIFGGRYKDTFERVDGEWVWRQRTVLGDVYGDTSRHVR